MSNSVQMPALGESVTEGTVTRWLKQVGDTVAVDEPLLEVSTDKVDTEIPSPVAGVLLEILVPEDETAEVGADLARVGEESEQGSGQDSGSGDAAPSAPQEDSPTPPSTQDAQSAPESAQEPDPEQPPAAAAPSSGGSGAGQAVQMPALGESVTEGTVTRWLKAVGDSVEVDEPLLEVSTDKVDTEIPSPVAGTLLEILVDEDETAEVGADLARIGDASAQQESTPQESPAQDAPAQDDSAQDTSAQEAPAQEESLADEVEERASAEQQAESSTQPSAGSSGEPAEAPSHSAQQSPSAPQPSAQQSSTAGSTAQSTGGSTYVTPLVRKLAKDLGVDLSSLTGTGVGGRIRKQDVQQAADEAAEAAKAQQQQAQTPEQAPAASTGSGAQAAPAVEVSPKRGTTEKMSRLRKVIAQRMKESLQNSAQLTTVIEVDVTRIARLRARAKDSFAATEGAKLTFLPFFVKASVEALKQHPSLNASIDGENIVYHGSENISMAVDTPKGLITPVIKDAGDLNLGGLARKIADLAARTRASKITPDDLSGGTFTITNTGSIGALFDTPILNAPQVAILGTGAIVKRPVVLTDADGQDTIAVRSMMYLALSYDHQIVDGADAARFLQTIKKRIEAGAFEGDLGL
ncbi:2-oxoglutarate dehydrogenase, E2 component, dihydrolipoamide succinyltransferase [Kineococcus sp. LSe6-4]|uniref:Dihydrolipoamide acetyltransferase component of pyruvate dehydrogenase complex n=1 Tax=Kineococcus halophytocola TaxID=3234027 RepID=A0ABV4GZX2_9ACTN